MKIIKTIPHNIVGTTETMFPKKSKAVLLSIRYRKTSQTFFAALSSFFPIKLLAKCQGTSKLQNHIYFIKTLSPRQKTTERKPRKNPDPCMYCVSKLLDFQPSKFNKSKTIITENDHLGSVAEQLYLSPSVNFFAKALFENIPISGNIQLEKKPENCIARVPDNSHTNWATQKMFT